MAIINLSIELPFKIGDKIWINPIQESEKYISIDKYRQIQEFRIVDIKVELDLKTGKKEISYTVSDGYFKYNYIYNGFVTFTKEQYYEKLRKELEELIPEDLRNYLWK